MDDALRTFVWERAGGRCEYCQLHQDEYEYQAFPVEHIIAKQHGGADDPDNLQPGVYQRQSAPMSVRPTDPCHASWRPYGLDSAGILQSRIQSSLW
jgi:hypothetical protein